LLNIPILIVMASIHTFVMGCMTGKVKEVRRSVAAGVDINGRAGVGIGLIEATRHGHFEIVKILLENNAIKLDATDDHGETALHVACHRNQLECVRIFLQHCECTVRLVKMKNYEGKTAEMIASDNIGGYGCARKIGKFLLENYDGKQNKKTDKITENPQNKLKQLSLTELTTRIEKLDENQTKLKEDQKTELRNIKAEYEEKIKKAENSHKRKLDDTLEKHDVENKKLCSENDKKRNLLHQELAKRLGSPPAAAGPSSSRPPAPPPSSLIPECPVCLEVMRPPVTIFTCTNGHLICSTCKPKIRGNLCTTRCKAEYTGRATAMEQMIKQILSIV